MVKVGRLERPEQPDPMPPYNPYEAVMIEIGGMLVDARPFEFDSEPVNAGFVNEAGNVIKPTKLITSCPKCGHGITIDATIKPLNAICDNCGIGTTKIPPLSVTSAAPVISDPFCSPIDANRLSVEEFALEPDKSGELGQLLDKDKTAADKLSSVTELGKEQEIK